MSRTPDDSIKEEILEKVLTVLARDGLNNLSLRDIAREVGVSARMLIYHFDSYEALINSVFIYLSIKHKSILKILLAENPNKSLGQVSEIYLEMIFRRENKKSLLLFVELYTKALRDVKKYDIFLNEVLYKWIKEIEMIVQPKFKADARKYATIILSFYRGLMLDWLTSNDEKRIFVTSKAFAKLMDTW